MFTRTASASRFVRQTLEPACARQVFAELACDRTGGEEGLRIRMDALEGDALVVQLAPSVEKSQTPGEGSDVSVELHMDGYRLIFGTRVRRVITGIGPGARPRVSALVLDIPDNVTRQQRRGAYRVPMAAQYDIRVDLCPAAPGREDCCPIDGRPFRGRMVNLSAGGVCTIVHLPGTGHFQVGRCLFVEFALPDVNGPFTLVSEIRHVRRVEGDRGILIGLKFTSGMSAHDEARFQAIGQFVTCEERRRLRRRR